MTVYPYTPSDTGTALGLIVLQTDETIEGDLRAMLGDTQLFVSRVPSGDEVTREMLGEMANHLTASARLLPAAATYGAVGYGCTSGTAQIGADTIARLVRDGVPTPKVSEPISALLAACKALGLKRIAFLSPYIAAVSDHLRDVLRAGGVDTPVFGTFAEAEDPKVVRIGGPSIIAAAKDLCAQGDVDGVFLSCTNLRTFNVIDALEAEIGLPVLSSNLCLGWHLAQLAGVPVQGPGQLLRS